MNLDIHKVEVLILNENKPNIVSIDARKKRNPDYSATQAVLTIGNETYVLDHFILSGITTDGKNCLLTHELSMEQLLSHSMIVDELARTKIRELLS